MNALRTAATLVVCLAASTVAVAEEQEHRLGEHPAVLVKRAWGKQGYDYVAQFYPHPAWLYLDTEPRHPMGEHPAVIVFRRHQHHLRQSVTSDEHASKPQS